MGFKLRSGNSALPFKQMGASSPTKHIDEVKSGTNRDPRHAAAHNKKHDEGSTHGEIGSKDNKWIEPETPAPAKQKEEKEPTKRALIERKSSAYGTSGGWESKEFVKGGREGDKTTKSTTYKKREAGTDPGSKATYHKTKTKHTRKGKVKTKTKEISAKKYEKQTKRKKARATKKGHDVETYEF